MDRTKKSSAPVKRAADKKGSAGAARGREIVETGPIDPEFMPTWNAALPEPWDLVVRPSASAECLDASFSLEDEALVEQLDGLIKESVLIDLQSDQRVIYCTKGFCNVSGYARDEILGRTIHEILHGEKTEKAEIEALNKALLGGRPCALVLTHYKKGKVPFKDLVFGIPLLEDGAQQPSRALLCCADVSDKRRNELNIEKKLEMVEQHMGTFFTTETTGPECNIIGVASSFAQLTGFTSSDVLGLNCLCLCGPGSDRNSMRLIIAGLRASGSMIHTPVLAYKRGGEPQWLAVYCLPLSQPGRGARDLEEPWDAEHDAARELSSYLASSSGDPMTHTHICLLMDITSSKHRRVGKYQLGRVIGRGASGVVRMGRDTQTGEIVAIKMVNASNFRSITEIELVQEEMRVLSALKHPHIIRLMDVLYVGNCIYFVMEFASGGSLVQYVWAHEGHRLKEEEALKLFRQMVNALDYCHRRRIVHRDLKPENILMDADNDIKIADFGLAAIVSPFSSSLGQAVGTPEFAAPEIIGGKSYDGPSVDIWSMGVILYELTAGFLPFQGKDQREMYKKIQSGDMAPFPAWVPDLLRDLIRKMLTVNPEKRITLEGIRKHAWAELGADDMENGAEGWDSEDEQRSSRSRAAATHEQETPTFGGNRSNSSVWSKAPRSSKMDEENADAHSSLSLHFNFAVLSTKGSFKDHGHDPEHGHDLGLEHPGPDRPPLSTATEDEPSTSTSTSFSTSAGAGLPKVLPPPNKVSVAPNRGKNGLVLFSTEVEDKEAAPTSGGKSRLLQSGRAKSIERPRGQGGDATFPGSSTRPLTSKRLSNSGSNNNNTSSAADSAAYGSSPGSKGVVGTRSGNSGNGAVGGGNLTPLRSRLAAPNGARASPTPPFAQTLPALSPISPATDSTLPPLQQMRTLNGSSGQKEKTLGGTFGPRTPITGGRTILTSPNGNLNGGGNDPLQNMQATAKVQLASIGGAGARGAQARAGEGGKFPPLW